MSGSESEHEKPKKDKKKKAQKKRELSSSGDEGVVDAAPLKKKVKNEDGSSTTTVKNAEGDEMIEIGKMKFATVRSFKGQTYVDIREYYMDKSSGEMKPGKKGISLNPEQYANFKKAIGDIDKKLAKA
ncbi:hypothetical protein PENTCL1PPCAC_15861 [Pristionchus entomophagus]|uniref:Transcriptional coactivator p15 (PC4) C-terminal domain-containing protein n=1 Tax=Pristionchus entomophagus TaxID=358040 RepID=A0AAV5TH88_9BILA|nr:hypothetical protein PENTCL1PPCAC_15861 [Pristionchus entomophagus]